MNIAIVGGGQKCQDFLDLIETHAFRELKPRVVALADVNENSHCMLKARKSDIFVTTDYNDLLDREDIDLIVEMADSEEVFYDILNKKKKRVRAFNSKTAQLFWEVSRISNIEKETKQKLLKANSFYSVFINELLQEETMVISPSYEIQDVNEALLQKIGLQRDEVIGRFCFEVSHQQSIPCDGIQHPCPLRETLQNKKPSQATHIHLDKDGREIYYSISCYPILKDGEVEAVLEISKDITRDIKLQKMMMQQEKMASIGRLAAGVAHEINNPMTTILTTSMLIQEDLDPEDPMYQELQTISNESLRCRKIVASLLDFARQTEQVKKEQDINHIVSECIELIKKQAAFKDVGLEFDPADDLPLVAVDKDQIQQSLINLAMNGIEATDAGGKVKFSTRFNSKEQVVEITVSDTGHGIDPELKDRIFDPFFTTKENGTGLGMAIIHGLVEQHEGSIQVESTPGQGSSFTVKLPLGRMKEHE